jgi:hypothetical protein
MLTAAKGTNLFPGKGSKILIDNNYIMASLGVMSIKYRDASIKLMKESMGI